MPSREAPSEPLMERNVPHSCTTRSFGGTAAAQTASAAVSIARTHNDFVFTESSDLRHAWSDVSDSSDNVTIVRSIAPWTRLDDGIFRENSAFSGGDSGREEKLAGEASRRFREASPPSLYRYL